MMNFPALNEIMTAEECTSCGGSCDNRGLCKNRYCSKYSEHAFKVIDDLKCDCGGHICTQGYCIICAEWSF